jgi:hypothetical protein
MLVPHFPPFKVLAVPAEALADNVERLTTFIRTSPAGIWVALQLSLDRGASAAISQAEMATNVSIWAVDYLIQQVRRYAPPHNGTIAPMLGLFANGFPRHSFATQSASYNVSRNNA